MKCKDCKAEDCKHEHLEYCESCGDVHCVDCGEEWEKPSEYPTYPAYPYIYQYPEWVYYPNTWTPSDGASGCIGTK